MICSNSGIEVTKYEQMLLVWYAMDYGIEFVIEIVLSIRNGSECGGISADKADRPR